MLYQWSFSLPSKNNSVLQAQPLKRSKYAVNISYHYNK